jgi:hypothetical protein
MPKSPIQIPIASFSGVLGKDASLEEDIRFIRWRCEELIGVVEAGRGIIVDLRQVDFETSVELDVVPSKIRSRQEPVRIVVQPDAFNHVTGSFLPTEVSTEYESVFPDLAFELKDYRFDKGRKMMEKPKLAPLQLMLVSLDISAILFESYTWQSGQDSSVSGYVVFRGQYRYGSAGSDDALLIKWRVNQFCDAIEPIRLIVDLRELDYQWGDDFNPYPFRFLAPASPIRFLLKPEQVSYYESTIYSSNICVDEVAALQDLGYS